MKVLRLDRRIRRDANRVVIHRNWEAVAAFEPRSIALALKPHGKLIAKYRAAGGELTIALSQVRVDSQAPRRIDLGNRNEDFDIVDGLH